MVVEMACECDDLPAHSHVYAPEMQDAYIGNDGTVCAGPVWAMVDTGEVRIWVDWKAVARAALSGDLTPRGDADG